MYDTEIRSANISNGSEQLLVFDLSSYAVASWVKGQYVICIYIIIEIFVQLYSETMACMIIKFGR